MTNGSGVLHAPQINRGIKDLYDQTRGEIHHAWMKNDKNRLEVVLLHVRGMIEGPGEAMSIYPNVWALLYEYGIAAAEMMVSNPDAGPIFEQEIRDAVTGVNSGPRETITQRVRGGREAQDLQDQQRIANGETAPWLGNREGWLDPR